MIPLFEKKHGNNLEQMQKDFIELNRLQEAAKTAEKERKEGKKNTKAPDKHDIPNGTFVIRCFTEYINGVKEKIAQKNTIDMMSGKKQPIAPLSKDEIDTLVEKAEEEIIQTIYKHQMQSADILSQLEKNKYTTIQNIVGSKKDNGDVYSTLYKFIKNREENGKKALHELLSGLQNTNVMAVNNLDSGVETARFFNNPAYKHIQGGKYWTYNLAQNVSNQPIQSDAGAATTFFLGTHTDAVTPQEILKGHATHITNYDDYLETIRLESADMKIFITLDQEIPFRFVNNANREQTKRIALRISYNKNSKKYDIVSFFPVP